MKLEPNWDADDDTQVQLSCAFDFHSFHVIFSFQFHDRSPRTLRKIFFYMLLCSIGLNCGPLLLSELFFPLRLCDSRSAPRPGIHIKYNNAMQSGHKRSPCMTSTTRKRIELSTLMSPGMRACHKETLDRDITIQRRTQKHNRKWQKTPTEGAVINT